MNFLTLEYFTVVAEELNITKAAERLYISQQSLSKQIIRLEEELDVKLFYRTPVFSLTFAGKSCLNWSRKILDMKRQLEREMSDISNHKTGDLRIGVSHTRGRVLLPKVLPEFKRDNPLIDVTIKEGNSKELEEWLLHGQIDLLIGFSPVTLDVAESVDILKERLLLVVPEKYFMEVFPDNYNEKIMEFEHGIDVEVFSKFPFLMMTPGNRVRTLFDRYVKRHNLDINIVLEIESIETLLALACKGMGITVYPEMFAKNLSPLLNHEKTLGALLFPFNDKLTTGKLVVAYHRERYLPEAAQDFIRLCREIKKELKENNIENGHPL
ncbi:MAG: LysR family transcriptional regulator [Clostridia bacterium]|nr:LysR family transcriptional regulator [Clostridia bacterium]